MLHWYGPIEDKDLHQKPKKKEENEPAYLWATSQENMSLAVRLKLICSATETS